MGPAGAYAGGAGPRPFLAPLLDSGPVLLQARRDTAADLRPYRHRKHPGSGRKSFAWSDYRDLVVRAHLQLGAPIVLIWDNLNTHRAAGMRQYAADHD